jgi:hypothetical protein
MKTILVLILFFISSDIFPQSPWNMIGALRLEVQIKYGRGQKGEGNCLLYAESTSGIIFYFDTEDEVNKIIYYCDDINKKITAEYYEYYMHQMKDYYWGKGYVPLGNNSMTNGKLIVDFEIEYTDRGYVDKTTLYKYKQ